MRILLTGGSGFIGRNLSDHISRDHNVLAPTHSELDLAGNLAADAWFRAHEVDAVIHNAICRALCSLPITLRQDRRFSYLFIDDLMPVIDWALAGQPGHVAYNVSPDWADSLRGLGMLVAARSGDRVPMLVANDGFGKEYTADNSRLRRELPQMTFTPPDVAIDRLFTWYSDRRSE